METLSEVIVLFYKIQYYAHKVPSDTEKNPI